MIEFDYLISILTLILILIIIIFIVTVFSTESIVNLVLFLTYFILLLPYYSLIRDLHAIILEYGYTEIELFNTILFFGNLINVFVGIALILNVIYS